MVNFRVDSASSKPQLTDLEIGIQSAKTSCNTKRALMVGKKGNLKSRSRASHFFLRMKITFMSKNRKNRYCKGPRAEIREKVLDKTVELVAEVKRKALVERHGAAINDEDLVTFLKEYKKVKKITLSKYSQLSEESFSRNIYSSLNEKPSFKYSKPPVLPDYCEGDASKLTTGDGKLTPKQYYQMKKYITSKEIFGRNVTNLDGIDPNIYDGSEILEHRGEAPKFFAAKKAALNSKERYSYTREGEFETKKNTGTGELEEIYKFDKRKSVTAVRESTLNIVEFRAFAEKQVSAYIAKKDARINVHESVSAEAVNLLCHLRQEIQSTLIDGEAPNDLQSLFNVNSVVKESGKQPDCLVASRKLVAQVVGRCIAAGEIGGQDEANRRINFANKVNVRAAPHDTAEANRARKDEEPNAEVAESTEPEEAEISAAAPRDYQVDIANEEAAQATKQKSSTTLKNDVAAAWLEHKGHKFELKMRRGAPILYVN